MREEETEKEVGREDEERGLLYPPIFDV